MSVETLDNIPTSLHNINFSDVLELPNGDIQRAESSRPPNASTAVDHYGRPQLVAAPSWDNLSHHLCLFLSDTLKHTTSHFANKNFLKTKESLLILLTTQASPQCSPGGTEAC